MNFLSPRLILCGFAAISLFSLSACKAPAYEIREDHDMFANDTESEHHEKVGEEMMETLLKQATEGQPVAMLELGNSFYNGRLFKQDFDQALYWYMKGAEHNNGECYYNLGLMYHKGDGVVKNDERAYDYFSRAADSGVRMAFINAAILADKFKHYEEARIYYLMSANANDENSLRAMKRLAKFYETGKGGERDNKKAISYYTVTAEKGDSSSQMRLANAYNEGKIVQKNYQKALYWLKSAADKHPEAQTKMGYCYEKGFGVARDYNLAIRWYQKAAKQQYAPAQIALGYCYSVGSGVGADNKEAFRWFSLAAQNNDPAGMYQVASCYLKGRGIKKDIKQAITFFERAAKLNYPSAIYTKARYIQQGKHGYAKDDEKAFLLFQKAALSLPEAYYELALCHLEGRGTTTNESRGTILMKRAAKNGSAAAERYLITKEFERRQRM